MKFYDANRFNFAQLKKLQVRENLQSKNILSCMKNKHLEYFVSELNHQRNEDSRLLSEMFEKLKLSYEDFSANVSSKEKIKSLDVEFFKNQMQCLQIQISNIYQNISEELSILKKKESELQHTISVPIQSSEKLASKYLVTTSGIPSKTLLEENEISMFQKFVSKTGQTGGWDVKEHVIFTFILKKWQINHKTNNMPKECIAEMLKKISDITVDDLLTHKSWWDEYCALKNRRDKVIDLWKLEKNEEKQIDKKMSDDIKKNNVLLERINNHERKLYTEQLKAKIDVWKHNINEKNLRESEEKRQLHYRRNNIKKRRKINKEAISKWLQKRKSSPDIIIVDEDEVSKEKNVKKANVKPINYYRKQDEMLLKKKMKLINDMLETKNNKKQLIINSANSKKQQNIKSKYLESTEQWTRKTLKMEDKEKTARHIFIINDLEKIPKLAIPEWRCGISIR